VFLFPKFSRLPKLRLEIAIKLLLGVTIGGALISGFYLTKQSNPPRIPASDVSPVASIGATLPEPPICKDFYRSICQQKSPFRDDGRDPTGAVRTDVEGERMASSYLKDIIDQHPDWNSDQVDDELVKQIYTPERTGRIIAAYHWVQYKIEHLIESQPERVFTAREKRELVARVKRTELQLPGPASVYADEPDLFTKNDVFYERSPEGKLRMRVGGAYLFTAKSWFNIVFTFGHELGHSIDPCEIRQARLSYPAYDRLTACFLRTGIVKTTNLRSECQENDQLSEAFADWVGAQVSSEALKNFSNEFHGTQLINATENGVRDLCEQEDETDDELDVDTHPSPRVRIGRIYGGNPGIRNILGCEKPAADYCGFESVLPPPILGPLTPNGTPLTGKSLGESL
jgi:hypothetical protein